MAAIELGLNQYLALDPDIKPQLAKFEGKVIALEITSPAQTLYLLPGASGIQVLSQYAGEADTTISGSLLALSQMSLANKEEKTKAVFKGNINIRGDINLGQHFQSLFEHIDIDWEEHLSHISGDIIAHQVSQFGRKLFNWGKSTQENLSRDVKDYLNYETRDLLDSREMAVFLAQVDDIRNDVDRLESRLKRLQKAMQDKN